MPSSIVAVSIYIPTNSYVPHFYLFLCHIHLLLLSFSCPVMSDSLWPHGLQHVRPPCPSPSPGVSRSSCPLHQWCYWTILPLSHSSPSAVFPTVRVFSSELAVHIRWPKYWSFSVNPSDEYSGLISFKIDWFDLHTVQGTPKSLL